MTMRLSPRIWLGVAIAAVLALAVVLRAQAIDFGLPALLDPDEPIFLLLAFHLLNDQTLNPQWFGHPGTTTIYCLALIEIATYGFGHVAGWFADPAAFGKALYTDPAIVVLPARWFIVLCGLATIALTYKLGKRLFSPQVGFVAMLMLALDPVHIRYSQIIRTDMQATVFVLLVLLMAAAILRRGHWRDYCLAGIALGLAVATKWPAAASIVGVFGAAALRAWQHSDERSQVLLRTIAFGAVSVVTLLVVSPYLVLDYQTFLQDMQGEKRPYHLGATGSGLFGNIGWYLRGPLLDALGPLGGLAALAGLVVGARRSPAFAVIVLPVCLAFMLMISAQALVWERWIVPILPLLSIALGAAAVAAYQFLRERLARPLAYSITVVAAAAALVPVALAGQEFARERSNDTRLLATQWAREHIAAGSTVTVEHMAFDALQQPWTFLYPAGDAGCVDARAALQGKISYSDVGGWRGSRPVVDIGTVAPAQLFKCRGDFAILVNWDRYLAERDRFPAEAANYARFTQPGEVVATFTPKPGERGGPTVRIVRFGR